MSLTYSLQKPDQSLSRTTAIAFIVALHAVALMAFNNGIGSFFHINPPKDIKVVDVKPEPKVYEFVPPPDLPPVSQPLKLEPRPVSVGDITPEKVVEGKDIVAPPPDLIIGGGGEKIIIDPTPVARLAIMHRVDPAYPASAERAGEEGTVLLEIQVDTLGRAMNVQVARSSGFDALDRAAMNAVKQWKFNQPSTIVKVRVPVTFKLSQRF
ncbi:MAG TPA: TonB family protein [Steroidobacteraceae bacterium]|jgi:protein TonB|nr:TonB family protein [Steroidobacteraceae bacterium]